MVVGRGVEDVVGVADKGADTVAAVVGMAVVLAVVLAVAGGRLLLLEQGCQRNPHRNTLYIHFLHKYLDKKNRMPAPEHE